MKLFSLFSTMVALSLSAATTFTPEHDVCAVVMSGGSVTIVVAGSVFIGNYPRAVRSVDNAPIGIISNRIREIAEDRYAPPERDIASRENAND